MKHQELRNCACIIDDVIQNNCEHMENLSTQEQIESAIELWTSLIPMEMIPKSRRNLHKIADYLYFKKTGKKLCGHWNIVKGDASDFLLVENR